MGSNTYCMGLRGKGGVFCNFELLVLALERSLEVSHLNQAV